MINTTYAPLSAEKINTLDSSTIGIVELAKALLVDKEYLPNAEFRKLVQSFGWGRGLVQTYLKIAQAFADVDVKKLMLIEPRTLFKITSSKKFAAVVDGIRSAVGHVTQQFVENLIEKCKTPRTTIPKKPSIWRSEKDGSRSCVVPPIKEDDQFTGMSIQHAMDSEGISAQLFVREAAAFREAWFCGAFLLVGELPPHLQEILASSLDYPTPAPAYDEEKVETNPDYTTATVTVTSLGNEPSMSRVEENAISLIEPIDTFGLALDDNCEAGSRIELMSIEEIANQLRNCTTCSEVAAISSSLDKSTCLDSWAILNESEQQQILEIKSVAQNQVVNITENQQIEDISIQVGDKVMWANHYPYLSNWLPLKVERINDDGQVKLELCDFLVPMSELSLY
jgi:hypothetical protein